jgi:P27 family predicted phage terminase small subunit
MARGRKPKPDALHQLAGNPGKRKRRVDAPVEDLPVPDNEYAPPAMMTKRAALVWRAEMPRLRQLNMLKPTDLAAFAIYCETRARWEICRETLDEHGLTYATESKHGSMVRVRPEVAIMQTAERSMAKFLTELGMTSVSRIRALANKTGGQLQLPLGEASAQQGQTAQTKGADDPIGYLN